MGTTGPRTWWPGWLPLAVLAGGALLAAAGAVALAPDDDDPPSSTAPAVSGPLRLSTTVVGRGERLTAELTDGREVPGAFSLAVWDGTGWSYQYQLFGADEPFADDEQAWRTWRERTAFIPDPDVGGGRPVHLRVPTHVVTGDFRVCAEPPQETTCAALRIVPGRG